MRCGLSDRLIQSIQRHLGSKAARFRQSPVHYGLTKRFSTDFRFQMVRACLVATMDNRIKYHCHRNCACCQHRRAETLTRILTLCGLAAFVGSATGEYSRLYAYTVQTNDTLEDLAKAYRDQGMEVTAKQILVANPNVKITTAYRNGLRNLVPEIGAQLFIPSQVVKQSPDMKLIAPRLIEPLRFAKFTVSRISLIRKFTSALKTQAPTCFYLKTKPTLSGLKRSMNLEKRLKMDLQRKPRLI